MLPIPAFVALVLGYIAIRTFLAGGRPFLLSFLTICAFQSLLVMLVGGYGVSGLRPILPVSATIIPPLAWITFQDAMVSRIPIRAIIIHGAAPAFAVFCRIFAPETTDFIVPLVFAGYGGAILLRLRNSSDMPLARLEAGQVPAMLWQVLGWALIASALSDLFIAAAFLTGNERWTGWLITIFSSLVLLLLGTLSVSPSAAGASGDEADCAPAPPREAGSDDAEIIERLETLLAREPLHLDPNLTLSRLARRLHLPEKRLSGAVNRSTGNNVSRYINSWRIRHACSRIDEGASVTDAMLDSGFNTKSNFNREFLRETHVSPSQWRRGSKTASNVTQLSVNERTVSAGK
ncbi:helix-turn-helix domain-containing protein [Paracoccus albus]|uniref:helix-turn-helix domain-containing protein n=1 Tax=Paracoccus albus TaxID=3017784 RepID=UPI0022F0D649|nr:AraC family transcriptional regulator [Paracoccus albus]WBU60927.1 AraC family transcriptional regulator [Paracoccus albus]